MIMHFKIKKGKLFGILFLLCCLSFIFYLRIYKPRPWIFNYMVQLLTQGNNLEDSFTPKDIVFLYVDHFEPQWKGAKNERQKERILTWVERYPKMAEKHLDFDGRHPQYSWFYMVDSWENRAQNFWNLNKISKLCYDGFGEIELHIHHGPGDSFFRNIYDSQALHELINELKYFFSLNGALITSEKEPRRVYGFIHGMWALDNSIEKYCGVDDELTILKETECYCDFTMPSGAASPTQSTKINCIYYAKDDPERPKSYDKGRDVSAGGNESKNDLMIFSGPFHVHFNLYDITVDTGELSAHSKVAKYNIEERVDDWVKANIHVRGQSNWLFVKICTHGCMEHNFDVALGPTAHRMYSYLESVYNDGEKYRLHYVTAREAYNIVKAAEAGKSGNPYDYRNFIIPPYANTKISSNKPYQLKTYSPNNVILEIRENTNNVILKFKELFMKEIRSYQLQSVKYSVEPSSRKLSIYLSGKGKTTIHLTIPKSDLSREIQVSNGTFVNGAEMNKEITFSVRTNLLEFQTKKIEISF